MEGGDEEDMELDLLCRGSHPQNEVRPPLSLEVWEHIFSFVEFTPTDFLTLLNTSPEWRLVLKPRSTTTLFPMVLPFLLKYLNGSEQQLLNTILSWRRIRRNVKGAVDEFLASVSTSPQKYYERATEKTMNLTRLQTSSKLDNLIDGGDKRGRIASSGNLHSLLRHFWSDTEGVCNPFLTRSAKIKINPYMVNDEQRLHSLLARYGGNISVLTLKMDGNLSMDTIHRLMNLLRRSPNVKILKFGDYFGVGWYEGEGDEGRITPVNFPNLDQLECLEWNFREEERFFPLGLQCVERYGNQLHTLSCNLSFLARCSVEVLNAHLPSVRCLRTEITLQQQRLGFDTLSQLEWQLKELHFSGVPIASSCFTEFFTSVNKFAPTLKHLLITAGMTPGIQDNSESIIIPALRMELRNLKKLSLDIGSIFTKWFVLVISLKFPCLNELQVYGEVHKHNLDELKTVFGLAPTLKKISVFHFRYEVSSEEASKITLKRQ